MSEYRESRLPDWRFIRRLTKVKVAADVIYALKDKQIRRRNGPLAVWAAAVSCGNLKRLRCTLESEGPFDQDIAGVLRSSDCPAP